jgi:amino acid adenylation domain-containing protein
VTVHDDLALRRAGLPPHKRAALERRLRGDSDGAPAAQTIPRRDPDAPLELSFAQQRLWFLDQLAPGNPFYTLAAAVRLRVSLAVGTLEAALTEIVRRHEILRTVFVEREGKPFQHVLPPRSAVIDVTDLRGAPDPAAEAVRVASAEARTPFDIAARPPFRVQLLRLGTQDWVLLLTMHHIVSDAWSMGVLLRELTALYQSGATSRPSALPQLPVQYGDYAAWQRRTLRGPRLDAELEHWRARLAGAPRLDLPTDLPRPPVQSFAGASEHFSVPRPVVDALRAVGRQERATLFMVLYAAFVALLSRHADQDDVLIGSPVAGRTRSEFEPLIGFFVNTLVLRLGVADDPAFRELVRRARETCLEAYAHQDVPFERLVEELQPERDLSRNPLFDVTFQLLDGVASKPAGAGDAASALEVKWSTAIFDLRVDVIETADGLHGRLEYSTDLFEAPTIERLAQRYVSLLAQVAADPSLTMSGIDLLGSREREQLAVWNRTGRAYPHGETLHQLVAESVRRHPDAVAVTGQDGTLTYAELDHQANGLAHVLRGAGAGRDVPVGVCLERGLDLVVALLAVLKAGAAYVPLDPALPAARLKPMARSCSLAVAGDRAPALPVQTIPSTAAPAAAPPAELADPAALAYVLYTSGSTGLPKGVMVNHGALVNHMRWMQEDLPLAASDRVLQRTPIGFDAAGWEVWAPLIAGAQVTLAPTEHLQDGPFLVDVIARRGATVIQLVPSLLRLLLDEPNLVRCHTLRRVCAGGEPLPAELVARCHDRLGVPVVNLYGPTETTIDSTYCVVDLAARVVPIGRPIANVRAHVVDRHGHLAPVGAAGELVIAGACVARGYLDDPKRTAERFVTDRWSPEGGPSFRTGDRVRRRADGSLQLLGRLDDQVKVAGVRIELGDVEAALAAHAAVLEAAAAVREDGFGRRLVGYVVPRDGLDIRQLRAWLRERLPAVMVPASIIAVDRIPRTPSGKIDRRALPTPERARHGGATGYVAPATADEAMLATIWQEVLGVPRVGAEDDFFMDLGGHSLLATQVIARVRRTFHVELPLRALFDRPTVRELAAAMGDAGRRLTDEELIIAAQAREERRRDRASLAADPARRRMRFVRTQKPEETAP